MNAKINLIDKVRFELQDIIKECPYERLKVFRNIEGQINYISGVNNSSCTISRLIDVIFKTDEELESFLGNFLEDDSFEIITAKQIY